MLSSPPPTSSTLSPALLPFVFLFLASFCFKWKGNLMAANSEKYKQGHFEVSMYTTQMVSRALFFVRSYLWILLRCLSCGQQYACSCPSLTSSLHSALFLVDHVKLVFHSLLTDWGHMPTSEPWLWCGEVLCVTDLGLVAGSLPGSLCTLYHCAQPSFSFSGPLHMLFTHLCFVWWYLPQFKFDFAH